ncbi:MAG: lytic transglycosylase domain-containing protein [Alphaproteobacteria bacterium]|nr:lytic transglycosylase domain-containing protein [Alphaproteobacteria bacterium]
MKTPFFLMYLSTSIMIPAVVQCDGSVLKTPDSTLTSSIKRWGGLFPPYGLSQKDQWMQDVKILRGLFPNHQNSVLQLLGLYQRHPLWWQWFPQTMKSLQTVAEKRGMPRSIGNQRLALCAFFHQNPPRTAQGWILYKQLVGTKTTHTAIFDADLSAFMTQASLKQFQELYPHLGALGVTSVDVVIAPLLLRLILERTTKSFSDLRTILQQFKPNTPRFNLLVRLMAKTPDATVLQDYAQWVKKNPWDPVLSLAMIRCASRTNKGMTAVAERLRMPHHYVQQHAQSINKWDVYILKQLMQEGQEAITKGDIAGAKARYDQALNMPIVRPTHPVEHSHLGEDTANDGKGLICFAGLKDYARAHDYFVRSAQNLPMSVLSADGIMRSGSAIQAAVQKGLRRHDIRALFWAGVCCQYLKKPDLAKAYYRAASLCSTFLYGQLACWKLGVPVKPNFAPPEPTRTDWQQPGQHEASRIIKIWQENVAKNGNGGKKSGQRSGATAFVPAYETTLSLCKDLVALAKTPGDYAKALQLIGVIYPDYVVESAKGVAKTSNTVFRKLYPILPNIRCKDPALVHSIILAESCFRSRVISWDAGIGLMQIMPETAKKAAKDMGITLDMKRLNTDSAYQIRMGTHIITHYINKMGGAYAPGVAAYNAGPHRAIPWVQNTPNLGIPEDGIVWIESIPYKDTHHYVLRIMESYITYRSMLGQPVMGKEWQSLLRAHSGGEKA